MTIIQYFFKELYFKIIYLMLIFILLLILIIYKAKIFFLYILEPIKEIKLNNFISNYQENIINYNNSNYINNTDEVFIPIIEINLPFFTTSYIFLKYIILFSIYLFIPIILYYIYIGIASILKKDELLFFKYILYTICIYIYINYIISHYLITPIYLNFIYSHYTEFLYYEFDVEFQLIAYLNFYFSNLFINFFLFVIILTKKYLKLNINNVLILTILMMIIPFDGIIQLVYIIIFFIYYIISSLIINYLENIKKYR
jgi:hypothetical protein